MRYLVTNDCLISPDSCDFMPLTDYEGDYGEDYAYYFIVSAKNDNDLAKKIAQYCKTIDESGLVEMLQWHCYPMQDNCFNFKISTKTIVTYNGTRVD